MHALASALLTAPKHGAKARGGGACPLEVRSRAGDSVAAASAVGYGWGGAAESRPLTRLIVDSLTSAGYAVRCSNPPAAGHCNSGHSLTIRIGHKNGGGDDTTHYHVWCVGYRSAAWQLVYRVIGATTEAVGTGD
jgi:hypothetical protein